ncbi:uncharacterized protein LOC127734111 isoform X3 [Mytilus californianus]|uniref:uncharacterized protein LOC127734111 isoform X2 n=1 Tax=Mytilus californianus TaxID=6549 RepID=UPI00224510B5|nr:uncharacterized protein LOC127734111 isoform X2 [Mytilus californianus]XP_052099723.1 uncharacterized protein LOC127734111 isoform X3 [Mytilus californianus]
MNWRCIGIVLTIILSLTTLFVTLIGFKYVYKDQKNDFQLTEDMLRIFFQLESLSTEMRTYCSQTDGPQKTEKCNNDYLYYILQYENRRLKTELQQVTFEQDTITCTKANNKRNKKEDNNELLRFLCLTAASSNTHMYGWIFGNRSLTFGSSDQFDIIIKFQLLYPEIADDGEILFEFGFTTLKVLLLSDCPIIVVRGQRCDEGLGICLYVLENVFKRLESDIFERDSEYVRGQLTLELHKSHFVLMSNRKIIHISEMLNISNNVKLWPVFTFYNTHLINISQTIFSEDKMSFDRTTVDPHYFISEDNNTISNCKLRPNKICRSYSDFGLICFQFAFYLSCAVLTCFFIFTRVV